MSSLQHKSRTSTSGEIWEGFEEIQGRGRHSENPLVHSMLKQNRTFFPPENGTHLIKGALSQPPLEQPSEKELAVTFCFSNAYCGVGVCWLHTMT